MGIKASLNARKKNLIYYKLHIMESLIQYDITNMKSFIDTLLGFFVHFIFSLSIEDYRDNNLKNALWNCFNEYLC